MITVENFYSVMISSMFDLIPGAAGLEPQSHPDTDILNLVNGLIAQAREAHQRRTILVAGDADWGRQIAYRISTLPQLNHVAWISSVEASDAEVISSRDAKRLLGQERDAVIFDAHSGFDPDAFGAVSGIIPGGGLLILLSPLLGKWEIVADPASERIAIAPFSYEEISGRFIRRLVDVVRHAQGICIIEQDKALPTLSAPIATSKNAIKQDLIDEVFRTVDQQVAVEAIEHVVHGHRRRPAVLVSDRGRGKSAALGIAAARLLHGALTQSNNSRGTMRIVVTAPRRAAVDALFFHAQQLLPESELHENGLRWNESEIQYIGPDVLIDSQVPANLLLVDEAAAIPASILRQLLERYSRIVFATTVHGYEGTGRGFAIRFREILDMQTPDWREVFLNQPIRWADNDPLEHLVFRALLLDADSVSDEMVDSLDIDNIVAECLDRDALVKDEQTLSQLFGLLVSAHYQTTPNDLRNLLDGPGVSVYVMRSKNKGHVLATALVSAEGEFSNTLAEAIYSGERRPRGHLIPQSLVAHLGIRQAASLRCARIMRIAVHPVLQRKGLGTRLLQYIRGRVESDGVHLFGTSFGATADLLKFWKKQNMLPVRVGFRRDHASGEHSVMMLTTLNEENNEQGGLVVGLAQSRFGEDLPHWLSDSLRELDCDVVIELLRGLECPVDISTDDQQMLDAFIHGARSYDDCFAVLWRFSLFIFTRHFQLAGNIENSVLVAKVIQKRSWQDVISFCGCNGRGEVVTLLRSAVGKLLKQQEELMSGVTHVGK